MNTASNPVECKELTKMIKTEFLIIPGWHSFTTEMSAWVKINFFNENFIQVKLVPFTESVSPSFWHRFVTVMFPES